MASIVSGNGGLRRIDYYNTARERKSLYLGKIPKKQAETILSHVEGIVSAQAANVSTPIETSVWLSSIGDKLFAKLVNQGLASERQAAVEKQKELEQHREELGPFLRITSPSEQTLSAELNGSTNTPSEI